MVYIEFEGNGGVKRKGIKGLEIRDHHNIPIFSNINVLSNAVLQKC